MSARNHPGDRPATSLASVSENGQGRLSCDSLYKDCHLQHYRRTGKCEVYNDYTDQQNAKRFSSSFSDRKMFTIYYLRGYVFQ